MLKTLAALGIGLITSVALPAAAHDDHARHGAHAPGYHAPAPVRAQPGTGSRWGLRRADYNRDGGVSIREAHRYARARFTQADHDRNGVLTGRELRYDGDFSRGPRARDGVVTLAEYDTSVRNRFHGLDRNRDGFLSRYELGNTTSPRAASYDSRW
jgi:hypothetical protein